MERDHQTSLEAKASAHLWMQYSPPGLQGRAGDPIRIIERGDGYWLFGTDGRRYLDGISALEAMILGHGDAAVIDAITEQARRLAFLDVFRFASPPQIELAARLASLAPGIDYVHFTPGGAEADETAIKLARQYHHLRGEPYRKKVITRQGAFHGVTGGAMALDGHNFASRNEIYDGSMNWGRVAPAGTCERCRYGPGARYLACAHTIEATIIAEDPRTVAAVVVDPAASAIGMAIPPDDDLRLLREVCDRHGVLLIVDEIITGFGRTGRMFYLEHGGVEADMICVAKGLTAGYVPMGATLISGRVAEAFRGRSDGVFLHGHTYGGHPVAAAAALTVLDRLESSGLVERAAEMGARLLAGLRSLSDAPYYLDARGRGLLVGLEIAGPDGRDFVDRAAAGNALRVRCRELGLMSLIVHPGNVLFIAPPLVIDEAGVDRIVEIIGEALASVPLGDAATTSPPPR